MFKRQIKLKSSEFINALARTEKYKPRVLFVKDRTYKVKSEKIPKKYYKVQFEVVDTVKGRQIFAECECQSQYVLCKHTAIAAFKQAERATKEKIALRKK
ncbi:MAG TPA: hypothetical protein PLP33_29205 [Leptospiraceae bacterium]|nr:hypothetical protein [Leptospiraceae bacterium]